MQKKNLKKLGNKILNKLTVEGNYYSFNSIFENPRTSIMLNGENLKAFAQRLRTKNICPLCHFY
jgi:hypothetical protein